MANMREIKNRMKSIEDTLKITNAMYLISSSKLKKARKQLEATEPYFELIQATLIDIIAHSPDLKNPYLRKKKEGEKPKRGYLIMTADRGLAGAYNHNILKMAEQEIKGDPDARLLYTTQNPTIYRARRIAEKLLDLYLKEELDEVYVIYTKMISQMESEPKILQVLPLNPKKYIMAGRTRPKRYTDFQPSVDAVLNRLVPNYIKGLVYGAMVESFSSELNDRMMAMEGASKSAREMIQSLGLLYNRARQAAITQEITEVVGGARALRKK